MEADWEIEIGGDAPIIEAHWSGFVDLRAEPWRVSELIETRRQSGLTGALTRLNAADSPVWTCKTDVFVPEPIDPYELDARTDEANHASACYIDVLPRSALDWNLPFKAEADCRLLCCQLRIMPLRCCRVDLVIRRAFIAPDAIDHGLTAYFTACGATALEAEATLNKCLELFAHAVVPSSAKAGSKSQ